MYSKNNSGPSADPFGTPCLISIQKDLYLCTIALLESLWLISIHCLLFDKKDLNHMFVMPLIP